MIRANGQPHNLMLLSLAANPAWTKEVSTHLTDKGYQCQTITDVDTLQDALKTQRPDAIISANDPDSLNVLAAISGSDDYPRPLRVLMSDSAFDAVNGDIADLVVGKEQITDYLPAFLKMQGQHNALLAENRKFVTENQQLQVQLKSHRQTVDELNLIKNAVIHNVSHELRTPLLQVKSAVALLSEAIHDKEIDETQKLVGYAKDATARLEAVIKNITQLAGSLEISPEPMLVQDAVDYALRGLRRIWERKDATTRVRVQLEDNLPLVMADKKGLGTVLQLLLDNALKFSEGDVEVIAQRVDSSSVRVSVRDYGIGIAGSETDAIFETFYQVDSSSTRSYGGTGVGLAIVRLILDRHKVKITVESQEGKGSTFAFVLAIVTLK
jgi:signal transduction histidine kinase